MSEEIYYADATTLARRIASGDLSPIEVVRAHLDRIEAANPSLDSGGRGYGADMQPIWKLLKSREQSED